MIPDDDRPGFRRMIKREPLGIVLVIAPWNYPYPDGGQHDRAGAHRRQCRDPEARRADDPGRRALPEGDGPGRPTEGPVPEPRPDPRPDEPHPGRRPRRPLQLHRLGRRRARDRAGGGRHLHVARPRARRQGPGLCARRRRTSPTRSRTSSTAPSSIPASAAAASSGSMCTRASTTASSKASSSLVDGYVLGNPLDEATTLGPMAHKRFADLVRQQTAEAVAQGREGPYRRASAFQADTGDDRLSGAAGPDRRRSLHDR